MRNHLSYCASTLSMTAANTLAFKCARTTRLVASYAVSPERHCTISALWVFRAITGSLTADPLMREKNADMEVWLIKAQPAVSVCPTCCVFEEVLCCGTGWVTYSLLVQAQAWLNSRVSKGLKWKFHWDCRTTVKSQKATGRSGYQEYSQVRE